MNNKNCKKCKFRRFTWDKGGMPTIEICHGKHQSQDDAIAAIQADTCDMYEIGHELYETGKVDGVDIDELPASKMYIADPMDFSKEPLAICDHIRMGMEACYRGEEKYCYCRLDCTSKMRLDDPTKMEAGARSSLIEAFKSAGIDESKLKL